MVKDETFAGWIIVSRTKSPVYTLVNPVHIENIYPSGNETVVCLTSGKKLVDKRPIDRFLKAEGGGPDNLPAVAYFGSVLRKVEERYKVKKFEELEKVEKAEKKAKEKKANAKPKKLRCKVAVDSYAGTAQGSLPIFIGSKIINRGQIVVTTVNGIELGKGGTNGQIHDRASEHDETFGDGVSGYISTDGEYKLVFKNAKIDVAVIYYEVIEK